MNALQEAIMSETIIIVTALCESAKSEMAKLLNPVKGELYHGEEVNSMEAQREPSTQTTRRPPHAAEIAYASTLLIHCACHF